MVFDHRKKIFFSNPGTQQPRLIVGVKMTGNKYVPAGKKTFIINMTDNMAVKMQHANIGFKNVR